MYALTKQGSFWTSGPPPWPSLRWGFTFAGQQGPRYTAPRPPLRQPGWYATCSPA